MFQPLIIIYKRGNFVYHHKGYCTSIYRQISYPFRSLINIPVLRLLYVKAIPSLFLFTSRGLIVIQILHAIILLTTSNRTCGNIDRGKFIANLGC